VVLLISFGYRCWATPAEAPNADRAPVPLLPGFLIAFLALVTLASTGWLPGAVVTWATDTSRWCLVVAIAAAGVKTSLGDLEKLGWQPVVMLVVETVVIALFVLTAVLLLQLGQN
jgi:uncharacterized membrane protein YadS